MIKVAIYKYGKEKAADKTMIYNWDIIGNISFLQQNFLSLLPFNHEWCSEPKNVISGVYNEKW
jgi:hypothetical protein